MATRPTSPSGTLFEAVVIGAGPAGTVSATVLASRGMRTLLVDRARFPRSKVCGGCLAPAGSQALTLAGIKSVPQTRGALELRALRVIAGGAAHTLAIKPYLTIERSAFDQALVQAALTAGAVFRDGVTAKVRTDEAVLLRDTHTTTVLHPHVIVVADGLGGSSLASLPAFTPRVRKGSVVGIGGITESRPEYAPPDAITMACARSGYVGSAPIAPGRWALAAAIDPTLISARGPMGAIQHILGESGLPMPELTRSQIRGVGNLTRHRRQALGRVLVVGDAASYLQPLTGEGMSWAMACAARIGPYAEHAARGLSVERHWGEQCNHLLFSRRMACRLVCALAKRPRLLGPALRLAQIVPGADCVSRGLCWSPA